MLSQLKEITQSFVPNTQGRSCPKCGDKQDVNPDVVSCICACGYFWVIEGIMD